jgi:hypothetical protein
MRDRKYSEKIERMLDVMLCMPKSAWGLVLERVESKIGAAALRRIILRAYKESDLKRGVAILDREEKRTEQKRKEKQKARQRRKRGGGVDTARHSNLRCRRHLAIRERRRQPWQFIFG